MDDFIWLFRVKLLVLLKDMGKNRWSVVYFMTTGRVAEEKKPIVKMGIVLGCSGVAWNTLQSLRFFWKIHPCEIDGMEFRVI